MPAVVDHERRRRGLAEIAARLVAEGGAEAATVRAVARAAGYSTKVVSHYFADKRSLLLATYRYAADHSSTVAEASQTGAGPDARAYLLSLLPSRPDVRADWLVWFAFWGLAITDPDFASEQRARVRDARDRIAALFARDPRYSGLTEACCADTARETLTLVIGVALQAIFDPHEWPAERQSKIVDDRLLTVQVPTGHEKR